MLATTYFLLKQFRDVLLDVFGQIVPKHKEETIRSSIGPKVDEKSHFLLYFRSDSLG